MTLARPLFAAVILAWLITGHAQAPDDSRKFSVMALVDRMDVANIVLNDYYSVLAGQEGPAIQVPDQDWYENYEIDVTETADGEHFQAVIRHKHVDSAAAAVTGATYLLRKTTKEILKRNLGSE